jgi:hypothetical protein
LTTGRANEGGFRVGADPERVSAQGDPEDIELQGWIGAEAMAAAEKQFTGRQTTHSTTWQIVDRLLANRTDGASLMQIPAVCETFGLGAGECARVNAYLGRLAHSSNRVFVRVGNFFPLNGTLTTNVLYAIRLRTLCKAKSTFSGEVYRNDFCEILQAASHRQSGQKPTGINDMHALLKFGDTRDASACFPTIYKTRLISLRDDNYVLLDLNHKRHWATLDQVPSADTPFGSKEAKLVWRGVSTGVCDASSPNSRMMLCANWFASSDSRVDVGFSEIVQNCSAATGYKKPSMSMEGMLRAKYILVANGNDKATGLNWALASNSVPFMVEPDVESWLLESSLKAWEHYVPIEADFSDLSSQVDWAVANDGAAERIAEAGKKYIRQFGTVEGETKVKAAVLTAYLDRVNVKGGGGHLEGTREHPCRPA